MNTLLRCRHYLPTKFDSARLLRIDDQLNHDVFDPSYQSLFGKSAIANFSCGRHFYFKGMRQNLLGRARTSFIYLYDKEDMKMKELAEMIVNKHMVTFIAKNGNEYRVSGWPLKNNVFMLDVMNVTQQQEHNYNYFEAVDNGIVFGYTTENNVEAIVKALISLYENDFLF